MELSWCPKSLVCSQLETLQCLLSFLRQQIQILFHITLIKDKESTICLCISIKFTTKFFNSVETYANEKFRLEIRLARILA